MGEKVSLKKKIEQEKEKFSTLDRHGKLMYFRDYYLIKVLIGLAIVLVAGWLLHDIHQSAHCRYPPKTL